MNYELLYETFPQLTQFQMATKNKYIFKSDQALLEVPKNQLTASELNLLSVFLTPLPESFNLQGLWKNYLEYESDDMPESLSEFQMLKISFKKPFHKIVPFQDAIESIVNQRCFVFDLQNHAYCILIPNKGDYIDFKRFKPLLEDDFKTKFTLLTTKMEAPTKLREFYTLLKEVRDDLGQYDNKPIYELHDVFLSYMMSSLTIEQATHYCQDVLGDAIRDGILLETVTSYLQNMYNFSQTAKALYIHRNTLQNRLDRFEKLSECNLKDSEDLFKIYMALKLLNMYKMHILP